MTSRVVPDTNVLVSALLFEQGRLAWLRRSWQTAAITPVLAESSARELIRVLTYPKFRLERPDIDRLLEDVLPWCETHSGPIKACQLQVRDPKDQLFLDLALAAGVPVLISGDGDLLALKNELQPLLILTPAEFQIWLDTP
ncbi:putative toxin-antitoxin system toxin component, PIN family [Cyanobium sp. Cruz CV13-4-11]|uniref:putative toxin-antitoxin system toxin component, PIN family n=1 Tax=unclassified Cyanobium TaxID=2627006 RepID=UPI0020CC6C56|nr:MULTISPECIES: putative toxin-antitoxin system toxin component, PIN family [unclassified Cyanobium]MCP9902205.1 putative toxin-antitoxin system toxin component, PIN family [Cyanobium sp. Cruz CV11-17]MCP9921045.1 putative toxin-antitoxin system toxin component, PIN family [Cyanobium sp. Cruz CV13-4-11]